jgi:hypothetical protein
LPKLQAQHFSLIETHKLHQSIRANGILNNSLQLAIIDGGADRRKKPTRIRMTDLCLNRPEHVSKRFRRRDTEPFYNNLPDPHRTLPNSSSKITVRFTRLFLIIATSYSGLRCG